MPSSQRTDTAAFKLEGKELDDGWTVEHRIDMPFDGTGGAYSVGYRARHTSGAVGFLKAFDYSAALDDDDPARELERVTATFNAERDLLEWCGSRGLRRIVRALAAGTTHVEGEAPPVVSYLIFEWADGGDSRSHVSERDPADQVPMIWLAHDAAAALLQLHGAGVMHQDVKPSNLLVWNGKRIPSGKLGDVGCAYMPGRPVPHDEKLVAGDAAYSAPELVYSCPLRSARVQRRQAGDVFMLGNLIVFLLVSVPYTGIMYSCLDPSEHWLTWEGEFEDVLPGLIDAHGRSLVRLREALHRDFGDSIVGIVDELCHPDPDRRGDPVSRRKGLNPYDLRRYVTRLDLIYRRAQIERAKPA